MFVSLLLLYIVLSRLSSLFYFCCWSLQKILSKEESGKLKWYFLRSVITQLVSFNDLIDR